MTEPFMKHMTRMLQVCQRDNAEGDCRLRASAALSRGKPSEASSFIAAVSTARAADMPGSDGGMMMYAAGMSGLLTGLPSLRCLFRRPAAENYPGFNRQPQPWMPQPMTQLVHLPQVSCTHGLQDYTGCIDRLHNTGSPRKLSVWPQYKKPSVRTHRYTHDFPTSDGGGRRSLSTTCKTLGGMRDQRGEGLRADLGG